MKLLESKLFKNICKGLGFTVICSLLLFGLVMICYDLIIKIYIHYGVISKAVTTTLLIYFVFWIISKILGLNFKDFLY